MFSTSSKNIFSKTSLSSPGVTKKKGVVYALDSDSDGDSYGDTTATSSGIYMLLFCVS